MRKWLLTCALLVTAMMASAALAQGQGQQQMPMMGGMMDQGGTGMMNQGMMGSGMCPMMGGMMGGGMQGMMNPAMMGMMMGYGPMVEARLAYVKAELGITDAQKSAWDAYANAVQARATNMQGMHNAMMQAMQTGSAIERLDAHAKAMASMVENLNALKPATEALYAVLSDDQKKKADVLLVTGCMM